MFSKSHRIIICELWYKTIDIKMKQKNLNLWLTDAVLGGVSGFCIFQALSHMVCMTSCDIFKDINYGNIKMGQVVIGSTLRSDIYWVDLGMLNFKGLMVETNHKWKVLMHQNVAHYNQFLPSLCQKLISTLITFSWFRGKKLPAQVFNLIYIVEPPSCRNWAMV